MQYCGVVDITNGLVSEYKHSPGIKSSGFDVVPSRSMDRIHASLFFPDRIGNVTNPQIDPNP
jgi:hypothetical protein